MDLINTGSDPWILEYDACEILVREILEHLNARNSDKISSQDQDAISAKIRIKLKQFSTELSQLNQKLSSPSLVNSLTPEERERRRRQLEVLQSKEVQLKEHFNQRKKSSTLSLAEKKSRAELLEKKKNYEMFADMGTTSWGESRSNIDEPETKNLVDMKSEHERLLQEQNKGLESLLKIVSGQKQIAISINDEVEHHNEILVDIADNMERVDGRMIQARDMVTVIGKKESIWGYWLVVFLLFLAIVGVSLA